MDKKDNMPIWRKVLVAICSLLIIACLILVGNIESIITNEESEMNKPSLIFEQDEILSRLLNFDELSWYKKEQFTNDIENLLKNCRTLSDRQKACNELYNNWKFVQIFGNEKFDSLISVGIEYDNRCQMLRNKVVSDAFNYLYSPFTPNGTRDNRKGLGDNWEKYNQMSIPAKEEFIRTDFQERYDKIVEKENDDRELWGRLLLSAVLLIGISIFLLVAKKPGKNNCHARKTAMYCILCFAINYIIHQFLVIFHPDYLEMEGFVIFFFLFSLLTLPLMEAFLANRSKQDYFNYYLIPDRLSEKLINNDYRKRLLMIFLIYPLFYIIPIPFAGLFVFLFYILPVLLILGIIWIIIWIKEGKRMDTKPQTQNERARLYCRHCGKLIDADSDFCRYCGKKL